MWVGVTKRFKTFHTNLIITDSQEETGIAHHKGVRAALNNAYYGNNSETANSFLVGSWGKFTRVRPPRDIDLIFVLPYEVYERLQGHTGNKQSYLLQEIKGVLQVTYPNTRIKGDGQVVVVGFNIMSVEVVPAFKLQNGQYYICDTHNGGSYKTVDPLAEIENIKNKNIEHNTNLRPLIMMAKDWQDYCNVGLKSFWIELLMCDFLDQSKYSQNGYFYYDWLTRDFFEFLLGKSGTYVFVPGTFEPIFLGADWHSKAITAHYRAVKACIHEYKDEVALAGEEWQKIFGPQIPKVS